MNEFLTPMIHVPDVRATEVIIRDLNGFWITFGQERTD